MTATPADLHRSRQETLLHISKVQARMEECIAFLKARADHFREHPPAPPKRTVVPGRNMMMMRPQGPDVLIAAVSRTDPELLALALLCQMLISSNEFLYVG